MFELEEHELVLLVEAVRTVDVLADLDVLVRREGVVIDTPQGQRAHPAAVEARQQRITLARLLAGLRVPDEAGARKSQRGPRGPYKIAGVAS